MTTKRSVASSIPPPTFTIHDQSSVDALSWLGKYWSPQRWTFAPTALAANGPSVRPAGRPTRWFGAAPSARSGTERARFRLLPMAGRLRRVPT